MVQVHRQEQAPTASIREEGDSTESRSARTSRDTTSFVCYLPLPYLFSQAYPRIRHRWLRWTRQGFTRANDGWDSISRRPHVLAAFEVAQEQAHVDQAVCVTHQSVAFEALHYVQFEAARRAEKARWLAAQKEPPAAKKRKASRKKKPPTAAALEKAAAAADVPFVVDRITMGVSVAI